MLQPELHHLSIDSLQAGHYQPRQDFNQTSLEELAQSIQSQGLIEPLIVRLIAKHRYEIIAGERRWRAAAIAGLCVIPCLVGDYSDKQACTMSLVENVQRQNLNFIEEACAYKRLVEEFHYQQDEIALLVGKSRSHIANILRLLSLSQCVKQQLIEGSLSLGHAKVLVGLETEQQSWFVKQVIAEQWSVRELEQEIKTFKNQAPSKLANPKKDRDVVRLETLLAEQMGAPVEIVNDSEQGGWLKVKFFDNDTLAGLLERLGLRYD